VIWDKGVWMDQQSNQRDTDVISASESRDTRLGTRGQPSSPIHTPLSHITLSVPQRRELGVYDVGVSLIALLILAVTPRFRLSPRRVQPTEPGQDYPCSSTPHRGRRGQTRLTEDKLADRHAWDEVVLPSHAGPTVRSAATGIVLAWFCGLDATWR
jgi:hypothetical protein